MSTAARQLGSSGEGSPLTLRDLAMFKRLGIGPELLDQAGVKRVSDSEARADFGIRWSTSSDMSGIVFPYRNATGQRASARIRRDNPEMEGGKEKAKYVAPWGDRRHLYLPPGAIAKLQVDTPIVLVEAEKSALALTAWAERTGMNLLALAMGGCWGFRGRIGKVENSRGERVDEMGPLPDLRCCDGRKVYVLLDSNAASNPKVKAAQRALVAELNKRGREVLVCILPSTSGVNGPDDYIGTCGDDAMTRVFADASERIEEDLPSEFADDALALKFTEQHGENLRYTAAWGRWSMWDGAVWKQDQTLEVFDLARKVCRAASTDCEKERLASRIGSAVTVAAIERLARADRRHAAAIDQWDCDPWLLNTPGGVADLHSGTLRTASREDYMTKITAVAPGGECRLWLSFLARITDGNEDLQRFIQRMLGYVLTGVTREHALFFLYGMGANGKSVLICTIMGILHDYAKSAPIEAFIASANEHHPTDLAGLQGARLVTAVETEDGRRWAESKLKALTGGDRIAARFMRQDYFEFIPQFKLLVAGNHKPGLRTVDEAMRRRFNLLPFTVTIPASERDAELTEKLRAEWGGILQWMIDGCLAWQRRGLNAPDVVQQATADYLASEDVMGRWLDESCIEDRSRWTSAGILFDNWRGWCERNQEHAGSQKRFSEHLVTRGFTQQRSRTARGFLGIGLVTGATDPLVIPVSLARTGAGERLI